MINDKIVLLESKAAKAKETKSKKGLWPWILGGIAAIGIAITAWLILRKLQSNVAELAKLRTEADQRQVKADVATREAHFATNDAERKLLERIRDKLHLEAMAAEKTYQDAQATHDNAVKRIISAKNWDDLDKVNAGGR